MNLAEKIRNIPDFPKKGILFRDITTLLKDGEAFRHAIDNLSHHYAEQPVDLVVAAESRGFILGAPIAYKLGAGFIPVRKLGKLPAATIEAEYALEYGLATVEMHLDAVAPGQKVLIVDDLLATGGTVEATAHLVERLGGTIVGMAFLIELTFLNARNRLEGYDVISLIRY
ncbi:MAG: adenine phosphoribosyltransferase [Chloroflexi bacterium]|nr:adenine phosphoribosyltransferase [Chloroflexota bacterium]